MSTWRGTSNGSLPPLSSRGRVRGGIRGKSRANTSWRAQVSDPEAGETLVQGEDSPIMAVNYGADPSSFGTPTFIGGSNLDPFGDFLETSVLQEPRVKGISTLDVLGEDSDSRRKRFETTLSHNRYLELKPLRESQRIRDIKNGLIPDPLKPMRLEEATDFVGTCIEMCPEWEREEREYQKSVEIWERYPGTHRIDPNIAVKAFHRPAAGNEQPLPSDVRPPKVLLETLDYLFHVLLPSQPLHLTHPFLRDRTRSVRQDLTMQNERGTQAIECNERIARYHIMVIGLLRGTSTFSESQELEQLRKVLKSLNEFYDDAREMNPPLATPNEPEFRSYNILTHLRDPDIIWSTELLPVPIFNSPLLQVAVRLHSLAQLANTSRGERVTLNAWSRFFKLLEHATVPFLFSCILSTFFNEIRLGALKSLKSAYISQFSGFPLTDLSKILGCDDEAEVGQLCELLGMSVGSEIVEIHKNVVLRDVTIPSRVSERLVVAKRGSTPYPIIIDSKATSITSSLLPSARPFIPSRPHVPQQLVKSIATAKPSSNIGIANFPPSPFSAPASSAISSVPPATTAIKQSIANMTTALPFSASPIPPLPVPAFFIPPVQSSHASFPNSLPFQPVASTSAIPIPSNATRPLSIPIINLRRVSVPLPSPVRGPNKAKLMERINKNLSNELIEQGVRNAVRRIAESTLKEAWLELDRKEKEQRRRVIADLTRSLSNEVVQDFVGLSVREIYLKEVKGLAIQSKYFQRWVYRVENEVRSRLEEMEKLDRLKQFEEIALGKGKGRALEEEDIFDLEFESLSLAPSLDLESLRLGGEAVEERLAKKVNEAREARQQLWSPGTFLNILAHKIDQLIDSDPEAIKRSEFAVTISTVDTGAPFSAWLACKFELDEEFSIALDTNFADVEVEMISHRETDLGKTCGIIIFDCTASSEWYDNPDFWTKARLRLQRLITSTSEVSIYTPSLFVISCADGNDAVQEAELCQSIFKKLELDLLDVATRSVSVTHLESAEVEFTALLDQELKSVNRRRGKILVPASKLFAALLSQWSASVEKVLNSTLETLSILTIASAYFEVLNEIIHETSLHLLDLTATFRLPPLNISSASTLSEDIKHYLSNPIFERAAHFPLIHSMLQSRPFPVATTLLRVLLQHLAEISLSIFSDYQIQQSALESCSITALKIGNRLELISKSVIKDLEGELKKKRKASPDHRGHGKKQSVDMNFDGLVGLSRLNSLMKDAALILTSSNR